MLMCVENMIESLFALEIQLETNAGSKARVGVGSAAEEGKIPVIRGPAPRPTKKSCATTVNASTRSRGHSFAR